MQTKQNGILAPPSAERSIKLREIQGHTPGSSRGFAKAASSFYAGTPSNLRLAGQLGKEVLFAFESSREKVRVRLASV
jgi:hypothetical protein